MWLCFYIAMFLKLKYRSSFVFHSVILKMLPNYVQKDGKPRNVSMFLYSTKLKYQSSLVFHTGILKMLPNYIQLEKVSMGHGCPRLLFLFSPAFKHWVYNK